MTNPLVLAATYNKAAIKVQDGGRIDPDFLTREHAKIESALKFSTTLTAAFVNVTDLGADPTGARDSTTAIQKAINLAGAYGQLLFPAGLYACVGLTNTHIGQRWMGLGLAQLVKNGNGVILTGSAREQEYHSISFDGNSATYSGNNVNLTGDSVILHNCSSYDAAGRALLATGTGVQILGDNGKYATTDATASGYDIEIGVSGTATLYHRLIGIRTSQATGGFKFVDCGSQQVQACQFGKYTVSAGTSPAGVNGGSAMGNRILGPITIDLSNSSLLGNARGPSATLTYGAGTSGHLYLSDEPGGGAAITNDGNDSSLIMRQVGNDGDIHVQYGDDSSEAIMVAEPDAAGLFRFPGLRIDNNRTLAFRNAADDGNAGSVGATAADNVQLVATTAAIQLAVATGQPIQFVVNSAEVGRVTAAGIFPGGATAFVTQGAGTPEGAVTAPVGSLFLRTDGGAATSLYVKESGAGNTGWVGK